MWLPWEYAVVLAALCLVVSLVAVGRLAAIAREIAILASLYALWQFAGRLSVMRIDGATARGLWIWDAQSTLGLPSEAAWQEAIIDLPGVVQAANIYYGGAHVPGMGVFLCWLFFAHRGDYAPWRITLALSTAACLVIQLLPVAPPRLIPELGMVDTGIAYGQSVYAAFGSQIAGQLQAMPSIHVGWAVLIAASCWAVGGTTARLIGVAHAVLTMLVVVVTANHYWLDGIVAALIVAATLPLSRRLSELLAGFAEPGFGGLRDNAATMQAEAAPSDPRDVRSGVSASGGE